MASILADDVVGKVCDMAIKQMGDEVSIVWNFTEDFEWLNSQFMVINSVLNEANEESTRQKESVKLWLQRVRDIAWEAEDILEERAVDAKYATNTHLCLILCYLWDQFILRHQMGRRIQKLKARLSSVVEDGNRLNIVRSLVGHKETAAESSSRQRFKGLSVLPRDSKPVGIEAKIESMEILLKKPHIPIIAVVGMGGMGKTFLLQNLYNGIKGRYETSAWLSVSQFCSVSQLQRDLAFQLSKDLCKEINESGISDEVAAELIYNSLVGKRYLIVLDDVWRASTEGDLIAILGVPSRDDGESKILLSTRSRELCRDLNAHIYEMEYMTDEQSWSLFCAHAFPRCEEGNRAPVPEQLEKIAHDILKKCRNLPLAIKTTAAYLARKTEPSQWHSMLNKLSTSNNVSASKEPVMDILKLSFDSLPAHLKACFAHLSFFPEDEKIDCEYLTYLWRAEGFIPAGDNPWDCLDQLADLCLVEVWEERQFYGNLKKYCKIHDLLLDLAIHVSRENKCAFRVDEAFSELQSENSGAGGWCRLFLAKKGIDKHAISKRHPVSPTLVRTLSLSHNTQIGTNIPIMLFSGIRVLWVLDLSFTNISTLPACVGEMKLLKVLNLRSTNIRELPECVRCLKSLTFLNLYRSRCEQVPEWISELKCLQHLEGPFWKMPRGISKLESLQILRTYWFSTHLSMEDDGELRLEDVSKMREIQEMNFRIHHESQLKKIEEGILAPLQKMRQLGVCNCIRIGSDSNLPQFPETINEMKDLELLDLSKFAMSSWIWRLSNLKYLSLWWCDWSNYPDLQAMPNLVSLQLKVNKSCIELPKAFGKSGGFPQLRFFSIDGFPELKEFPELEDGAMACVEELRLLECKKMNRVGEGLERLKRLKKIDFWETGTDELRETLKEGGMYWKKIKATNPHIAFVDS